ncbi:immunoglobulin-like domain-containing protein [Ruminococcus sp.]|uniref:immunoglobulin-like domain-containing protein n=1 Tax=Ruminococcus sp. TaxID=41978 RepID=UPI00388EB267
MKVMRYGSKYRYNQSKSNPTKKIVIIAGVIVAVVLAVLIIMRVIAINKASDDNGALSLQMRDGKPAAMAVKTGDICILTMPSAIDMKEVEFTSSDPAVVRVDSAGHTDALAVGKATVTATSRNFTAECEFTVSQNTEPERPDEVTTAIKANEDVLAANRASGDKDIFSITVNRRTNTVTVYTKDENGAFTVPVRAMVCSCGTGGSDITITGDFSIYFQEPWHPLFGDVYGMFVSGFEGPYLFHSVPYTAMQHDALETEEFNKLGELASQGCVRMMVADVYWIGLNCGLNTPVHVIDADAKADPLGKPAAVKIPDGVRWDPTDNTEGNPFLGKMPTLEGATDIELKKGERFDAAAGVTAADICGNDITDRVKIAGEVIVDKPGVYYLTYTVVDDFNLKTRVTRTVTVTG